MSVNNGASALPPLAIGNPCVQLLEQLLAEVRAGKITSVAVVGITPTAGAAAIWAGAQIGELYVGTGMLSRRMLAAIEGQPAQPARSSIIPARFQG